MTTNRFTVEFDGHQYFLVIDEVNERCLARLDTRFDAIAWLEIYKMLSEENEQLKFENNILKCALALSDVTFITAKGKKINIPPYYEFEDELRYHLKKEIRGYDGYD